MARVDRVARVAKGAVEGSSKELSAPYAATIGQTINSIAQVAQQRALSKFLVTTWSGRAATGVSCATYQGWLC